MICYGTHSCRTGLISVHSADQPTYVPKKHEAYIRLERPGQGGKRIIVDGVMYPNLISAVQATGGTYRGLTLACSKGARRFKGHDIELVATAAN